MFYSNLLATLFPELNVQTIDLNSRLTYRVTKADWNDESMWVFAILLFIAHNLAFWGGSLFFEVVYRSNIFQKYRIQKNKQEDQTLLLKAYIKLALETIFTHMPIFFLILYPAMRRNGMSMSPDTVPEVQTMLWQIGLSFVVCDTIFYWSHRALHLPSLYGLIHKEHHKFKVNHCLLFFSYLTLVFIQM